MYKLLFGVMSLLCYVGCGSDVSVGGPKDNGSGGASAGSGGMSAAGANSAGANSAGASSGGSANQTPRDAARAYAKAKAPCQTDADCCLVVDQCIDQGLIVGVKDKDTVRGLLDSADMTQCLGCIPPFVQVSCVNDVCVGTAVSLQDSPNDIPNTLVMDHCGKLDAPAFTPGQTGTVLGCGG